MDRPLASPSPRSGFCHGAWCHLGLRSLPQLAPDRCSPDLLPPWACMVGPRGLGGHARQGRAEPGGHTGLSSR